MNIDMMPFSVTFGLLKDRLNDPTFISTHFVMVEVQTQVIEWDKTKEGWDDPLDLKGFFFKGAKENTENTTSSKPLTVTSGNAYYYLLFDLWYVNSTSNLQISILKQTGKHKLHVRVHIDEIQDFNVNWVDRESDTFIPRKYHGACESFNHNIWTFGGKGGQDVNGTAILDSLAYYEDSKNRWVTVESQSKIMPEARFGMQLFWYYNYLILFGGQGEDDVYFADLWIFDIIRSYWHKISDSPTGYEFDENSEEKVPQNRAFFGGELLMKHGSVIIFGGKGVEDINFWDMWSLDIENALQLIENPQKEEDLKLWNKIPIYRKDRQKICRYGHDSLLIDDFSILIFGGATNAQSNSAILYNINENKLKVLTNLNDPPSNRFYHRMIGTGNGVVLMYGGENENKTLSEYWMLKVNLESNTIQYIAYQPKSSYFRLIFAWREGFSFHYSVRINHPILIGGGFGNNQQGNALLSLPTITCANREEFEKEDCTPCPHNSYYNPKLKQCEWCTIEQFFMNNRTDYFNSKCKFCPPGTIGSQSGRCTSCLPGYIYDPEIKGSCRLWSDEKVCPFGTKHAFKRKDFPQKFDSIQYENSPKMFRKSNTSFDNTAMWVLLSILIWLITIFPLIFWLIKIRPTRRYTIKFLKEIDLNPITGGDKRLVVGGVISIIYLIILISCSAGIIIKYFIYNERVEATELANISNQNNLPESYLINLTVSLYSWWYSYSARLYMRMWQHCLRGKVPLAHLTYETLQFWQ